MLTRGFSAHSSNFSAFKAWYKREVLRVGVFGTRSSCGGAIEAGRRSAAAA